ncbi:MAG: glycogen debranching protein GlgX [Acidimicrobiales bacterium]|nr:glycogen debranching protein GlgX [Acidimicrobiales bacterium]
MELWPGQPFPLGATYDGTGTNFSVFSEVAERVELCLFDADGTERRLTLPEVTAFIHHGYVPGVGPGQCYGFRVHGPWDPASGARCNPQKLLLDPYAKAVDGQVIWSEAVFPYRFDEGPNGPMSLSDSAPFMPKSVVTSPYFDWGDDRHPRHPWHETILYEAHVKGITMRHPDVPPELRGTYSGLASPPVLEHLHRLGVTAIELMPVHQFIHDHRLHELGLRNYWGYNSIAYLAPHNEYSSYGQIGQQVQEFKHMVKTLHAAGIEVILDVVYNHTAEGDEHGPMLCFKGIDNAAYYRLDPNDPRRYIDYTGTGNSLNMRHPHVLQLVMDSLRYWVLEMHVDGFRFDLAAALARELHDVDKLSSFFDLIQQDPVVSQVKLIAEPWDVGEGGYQVGNFPPLWSEWNGKYRDEVRDFWRGADHSIAEFAYRFTGSSDLYETTGRTPSASINFVTCHDGFTLTDLVSYNQKHNGANGEENRDGADDNRSWNCGVEGPTDDEAVNALRRRQRRNFLVTLLLSQGVPMMLGGDEIGRTQHGNNNAYNQDNEISWFDWGAADRQLLEFTRRLAKLRRHHPVFRRRRWFQGRPIMGEEVDDISWFTPEGRLMLPEDWQVSFARSLGVFLNGDAIAAPGPRGERIVDASFFVIFNASDSDIDYVLPPNEYADQWFEVLTTVPDDPDLGFPKPIVERFKPGDIINSAARSVRLLAGTDIYRDDD